MRKTFSMFVGLLSAVALWLPMSSAQAVPAFARQTGWDCTTCHLSWLELTNVGRRFKLGGYQETKAMPENAPRSLVGLSFEDNPPLIPLAYMLQVSNTHTNARSFTTETGTDTLPFNDQIVLQQASIFLNGKLFDKVGCFCQWTYDDTARHSSIDNAEIRFADEYKGEGLRALYGLSLNNSPTMSDIYNTTPVWGWPYVGSTVAPTPSAATLINGGLAQQAVGLSAYTLVNQTYYAELGAYRTADKLFSIFRAGVPVGDRATVSGAAPYYRFALQQDWDKGRQSAMVGAFGLTAKKYPDNLNPTGLTDRFRDNGIDAQYQYITDQHRIGAQFSYIREKQDLAGSVAGGGAANNSNTLNQLNTKISYYFDKWYGISVGYQRNTGSADSLLYAAAPLSGSANNSPESTARIVELNWLFSLTGAQTYRTNRLVLQYTSYGKFNGGTTNYDGFGRNAKDNNTLYLLAWLMY